MVERLGEVLRALPRTLREDLWTSAADPPPQIGPSPRREWPPVAVVALLVAAVVTAVVNTNRYAFAYHLGVPVGLLLAGTRSAALVAALFRPILAWWASTAAMVVVGWSADVQSNAGGHSWTDSGIVVQTGVLFLGALQVRPRVAAEVLVITLLAGQAFPLGDPGNNVRVTGAVLTIAVIVGASLRGRRVARSQLVVQEELTAEERARRTLLEERNRIARELHDVVAHHMSIISIQAQVAPHLAENPSAELLENLAGIRQNAVEALTELRRVLGVLRSEEPLSESARHAPQPTLDRLDELVGNVRGAGLTVTTETTGERRPLPPGIELSAFRIVQEALSNAMRHAPGAELLVEIGYHASSVTVRVANTAPDRAAPPSPGAGHGLLGMRERTAMLGGELVTGPTPDGGYEVVAVLPTQPPAGEVELAKRAQSVDAESPEPAEPAEDTP